MAEYTQQRYGELSRGVLAILSREPEGRPVRDVLERLAAEVPPTDFESEDWPKNPGVRRYEKIVQFSTIAPVRAGWLTKSAGVWQRVQEAHERSPERAGSPIHSEMAAQARRPREGECVEARNESSMAGAGTTSVLFGAQ